MLRSIKNVYPRRGKTQPFLLYKIGYDVETPSTTFGIDIFHPRAAELADKLDFLLITHNHSDHYSQPLIEALKRNGIPSQATLLTPLHHSLGGRTFTFWGNLNKDKVLQTQQTPRKICPCI